MNKETLRRSLRHRRVGLGPVRRRRFARRVAAHARLLTSRAVHIAAYLPHGSELDPLPLMAFLAGHGRHIYVPVVDHQRHGPLRFRSWHPRRVARSASAPVRWRRGRDLDLVLLPLLGFDKVGGRLGQGGGYYDRTFAFIRRGSRRPWLVGLGFECQRVASVPKDGHDVAMMAVITERRVWRARRTT
ncbi:MAG: 5-formyltetrahydrofolate cyclo-ligase [Acidiferrobacter sp.]